MKLFFSAWGSLGEVLPIARLAAACRRAGHQVHMVAPSVYTGHVQSLGVPVSAIGPAVRATRDRPINLLQEVLDPYVPTQFAECREVIETMGGCDAVVASWNSMGAILAAERASIPLIFCYLYPLSLMQTDDFPILSGFRRKSWQAKKDPALAQQLYSSCAAFLRGSAAGYFRMRERMNLPPYVCSLLEGPPTARHRVALFSRHLLRTLKVRQPFTPIGFIPPTIEGRLSDELEKFLAAGPAPVLVSFGTSVSDADLMQRCVEAARQHKLRSIVVAREAGEVLRSDTDVMVVTEYNPSLLVRRCCMVVAHGGIGTAADALFAGKPLLCLPQRYDQFDNTDRLVGVGVALRIPPPLRSTKNIGSAIAALMGDPIYSRRASAWPDRLRSELAVDKFLASASVLAPD